MLTEFSPKQLTVLNWWRRPQLSSCDAVICDGAVRSGKTLSMSMGFVLWATVTFNGGAFAMCGKTVTSLRRNVIAPLLPFLRTAGFTCTEKVSGNYVDISLAGRTNRFYYFGGRDESSAALIQGITLSGVFLDEVVLMPRSFVEQALARCSVSGSRMWFNCNPDSPSHWFYREWIKKAKEKNACYIHFTMDDNPSLSPKVRERYKKLYSGAFYERFVLGKWTASEGLVYPMFDPGKHVYSGAEPECERYVISCDYGTVNPSSFGLWGLHNGVWHRVKEYYYSSKREGVPRTDEEHYAALEELAGDRSIERVIVDPSAASFIECIRRHNRFRAAKADNDVVTGIRRTGAALKQNRLRIHVSCRDIIRRQDMSINVMNVKQIFTLFSGEPANVDWLAVITAACREVEGMLLPDADDTDVRLEFLAAAVANSRAQTIRLSSGKSGYEYAGSMIAPGRSSSADFAAALLRDYMELCRGLIKPKTFIFETIPTKEDT